MRYGQRRRVGSSIIRAAAACLAVTCVVGLAGCFWPGGDRNRNDRRERMNAIAGEVAATLAKRADVTRVTVNYNDDVTDPGVADASIQVTAGTAFPPVQDEALRLLWRSRLDPLNNIRIAIVDAADPNRSEVVHFDAAGKDKARLEGKYGKRPG